MAASSYLGEPIADDAASFFEGAARPLLKLQDQASIQELRQVLLNFVFGERRGSSSRRFTLLGDGRNGAISLDTTGDVPLPNWLISPSSSTQGNPEHISSATTGPVSGTFEMYGRIEPAPSSDEHDDERDCSIEVTLHGFPSLEGFEEVVRRLCTCVDSFESAEEHRSACDQVPAFLPHFASEGPFDLQHVHVAGGPFYKLNSNRRLRKMPSSSEKRDNSNNNNDDGGISTAVATIIRTAAAAESSPESDSQPSEVVDPSSSSSLPKASRELREPSNLQLVLPWCAARWATRYPNLWHLIHRKLGLLEMSVRSGELPPSGVGAANSEVAPHGSTVREEDGAQGRAREGVQGGGAGAGTHGEKAEAKESALVVEADLPGLGFALSPRGILIRALCSGRSGYWGQMPEPPIVWPPKVDETSAKKASSLRKQSPSQNHDNDNDNDDDDAPLERVGIWAAARKKNSSSSSSSSGGGESGQGKDDNDNDNDDSLLLEVPFSREAGFQLPLEGDLSISVKAVLGLATLHLPKIRYQALWRSEGNGCGSLTVRLVEIAALSRVMEWGISFFVDLQRLKDLLIETFELKFAFIPSTFREQTEGENSGAEEQYQDGDGSGGGSGAAASATGGASSSHSCGRYAMRISAQARLAPLVSPLFASILKRFIGSSIVEQVRLLYDVCAALGEDFATPPSGGEVNESSAVTEQEQLS